MVAVNYMLAPETESRVDGNIKATYGKVSYLARKLNNLLRCIGGWGKKQTTVSSILDYKTFLNLTAYR